MDKDILFSKAYILRKLVLPKVKKDILYSKTYISDLYYTPSICSGFETIVDP